jgi:hypothetical protein
VCSLPLRRSPVALPLPPTAASARPSLSSSSKPSMELGRLVTVRSMIPMAVELDCDLRLVWDGDGEVVVPGVRGIGRRWDGPDEFGRRAATALPALSRPAKNGENGRGWGRRSPKAPFPYVAGLGLAGEAPAVAAGCCYLFLSLQLLQRRSPDKCVLNLACARLRHMWLLI